jgi:hypothetical protein
MYKGKIFNIPKETVISTVVLIIMTEQSKL